MGSGVRRSWPRWLAIGGPVAVAAVVALVLGLAAGSGGDTDADTDNGTVTDTGTEAAPSDAVPVETTAHGDGVPMVRADLPVDLVLEREEPAAGSGDVAPPSGLDLGPVIDPATTTGWPDEGLAVEVDQVLVVLALDGRVLGHLPGFGLRHPIRPPAGPVDVQGPDGDAWHLDGSGLRRAEAGVWPLVGSAVVTDGVSIELDGEVALDLPGRSLAVDQHRRLATAVSHTADGVEPQDSLTVDLTDGSIHPLPPECWAAARLDDGLLAACLRPRPDDELAAEAASRPDAPDRLATVEILGGSGAAVVVDHPVIDDLTVLGRWRSLWPGPGWTPDDGPLLGQWSGECEVPTAAWLVDGRVEPVGGDDLWSAPASQVLGWTTTGDAVLLLAGDTGCSGAADTPGLHLSAEPGDLRPLLETGGTPIEAALWRP